jgi:hypothetical protein
MDGNMRTLRTAVVAGLAGSFAMDLAQDGFDAIFERGRAANDRDEETEAIVSVVRRIAPFVPGHLAERHAGSVGRALHYLFGTAFAIAYALARERRSEIAAAKGCAFGASLWCLSDVVLIPSAHLGRPFFRYSRAERINALVSHLAYGAVVEAVISAA